MREHHDRGDLSVAQVALERKAHELQSLTQWMRQQVPASRYPDQDTLHMALAPTLPGVPRMVHSVAASGEAVTHMYTAGVWTVCKDDQFLLRAIRYARLVATAIPLRFESKFREVAITPTIRRSDVHDMPCDLAHLGKEYDDIAVHAAIAELRHFRLSRSGWIASSARA